MPTPPTVITFGLCLAAAAACSSTSSPSPSPSPTNAAPTAASAPSAAESAVAPESNPAGDIPDNLAFVRYANPTGGYSFTYPEGWAVVTTGSRVQITDKLNAITADLVPAATAPTVATVRRGEVARLTSTEPAFELVGVTAETLGGAPGVLVAYRVNSALDPVTGRKHRDEVQEHLIWKSGKLFTLKLTAIVGADNVDAYRTITNSIALP